MGRVRRHQSIYGLFALRTLGLRRGVITPSRVDKQPFGHPDSGRSSSGGVLLRCREHDCPLAKIYLNCAQVRADASEMKLSFARLSPVRTASCVAGALLIIAGAIATPLIIQGSDGGPSPAPARSFKLLTKFSAGIGGDAASALPETAAEVPASAPGRPAATAPRATQAKAPSSPVPTTNPSKATAIVTQAPAHSLSGGPTISCDLMNNTHPKELTKGETLSIGCQVKSNGGFSAPTTLSCGRMAAPFTFDLVPGPFPCSFSPEVVTPPVDGTVSATYTLHVPEDSIWGDYGYGIKAENPGVAKRLEPVWPLSLRLKQPELNVACDTPLQLDMTVNQPSAPIPCQVTVAAGFDDTVRAFSHTYKPVSPPCDIQTNVPSLVFGEARGTQELSFTVTCNAEFNDSYLVRFQAGTGSPAQFVDVSFPAKAVMPSN